MAGGLYLAIGLPLLLFLQLVASATAADDWTRRGIGAVHCVAADIDTGPYLVVGSRRGAVARLLLADGSAGASSSSSKCPAERHAGCSIGSLTGLLVPRSFFILTRLDCAAGGGR